MSENPTDYERATAIVADEIIRLAIERDYPDFSSDDRRAMAIGILDRMANMHGWMLKRVYVLSEEEGE